MEGKENGKKQGVTDYVKDCVQDTIKPISQEGSEPLNTATDAISYKLELIQKWVMRLIAGAVTSTFVTAMQIQ
jgi:hypothetical protein